MPRIIWNSAYLRATASTSEEVNESKPLDFLVADLRLKKLSEVSWDCSCVDKMCKPVLRKCVQRGVTFKEKVATVATQRLISVCMCELSLETHRTREGNIPHSYTPPCTYWNSHLWQGMDRLLTGRGTLIVTGWLKLTKSNRLFILQSHVTLSYLGKSPVWQDLLSKKFIQDAKRDRLNSQSSKPG